MTIRLLQIIPTFERGGAEKQLTLLAMGLPRDEFDVHVCALTRTGPLQESLQSRQIPVTVIGKSRKVDLRAYVLLKRHIQQLRPDIVHTWLFAANAYGRFAALRCGIRRLVAGERCVDSWKVWHELAIDRYLGRRTSALVAPSSGVRDFYATHGLDADRFRIIPNGVPLPEPGDPADRDQILRALDLPSGARLVAIVGRLWPQKRVQDAIWAAELLSAIRDDVHLLIIGDGPQRRKLQRYASKVHFAGQIHFLGQRDDVRSLMPHFDCLWLASGYEGMPNSILEAMAAGVPVVATRIAGNEELVAHDETGYLVPVGDRAGFARFTNYLLDDDELQKRLGAAAQRKARDHYTVEQMVVRYASLYRKLMERD